MKNVKQIILTTALMLGVAGLATPANVGAVDVFQPCGANKDSVVCKDTKGESVNSIVTPLVNTLLFILGAISVVMIIVSGIRYTTSNGDASAVTSAKNTLMYSIIGLIVAILAFAIVNFVVTAFKPKPAPGTTATVTQQLF
ncbi:hypothetical protein D3C85_1534130 [compost metagenome]